MLDTPKLRGWLLAAALLWMAAGNGLMLWNTRVRIRQGYGDFASFYTAGTLVRRGLGAELYSLAAQWKVQREFASEVKIRQGPLPYIRPPFEALLFSVFARWPYVAALLCWTAVKLALLATIPFIVVRGRLWKESFPLWTTGILVLGTYPAFMDLLMGQDAVLLAFLFAVCFWQLETGREVGAGVTLGLALIKFQLAIPFFLILWISGRKRVLPGFAASASVVLALSTALVGWRTMLSYPGYLLALNRSVNVGIAPETHLNLRGLLIFFVGRAPYPGPIYWVLTPVALAAIVYTGLIWRRASGPWNWTQVTRKLTTGSGGYLMYTGRFNEGVAEAMRARELDLCPCLRTTRWREGCWWQGVTMKHSGRSRQPWNWMSTLHRLTRLWAGSTCAAANG